MFSPERHDRNGSSVGDATASTLKSAGVEPAGGASPGMHLSRAQTHQFMRGDGESRPRGHWDGSRLQFAPGGRRQLLQTRKPYNLWGSPWPYGGSGRHARAARSREARSLPWSAPRSLRSAPRIPVPAWHRLERVRHWRGQRVWLEPGLGLVRPSGAVDREPSHPDAVACSPWPASFMDGLV